MEPPTADDRLAALNDTDRRLYGRLSLAPGAAVDVAAAAALGDTTLGRARQHLDALVDAGLLRRSYSLTDPDDARRTNEETDSTQERHAALGRLIKEYLRIVSAAQLASNPHRWSLGRDLQQPPVMRLDPAEAVELLDSELDTIAELQLLAAELGLHREAWELVEALAGLFTRRKHYPTSVLMHERGLASAEILDDLPAQALMYIGIAQAYLGQKMYRTADAVAGKALEVAQEAGHRLAEASALEALGTAALATGRLAEAKTRFLAARAIHIDLDRPRGIALMNRHLGEVALAAGDLAEARLMFHEALDYFTGGEADLYHRARILLFLARTDIQAGEFDAAEQTLLTIPDIARIISAPLEHANALTELADIAEAKGELSLARQRRESANALYAGVGSPPPSSPAGA